MMLRAEGATPLHSHTHTHRLAVVKTRVERACGAVFVASRPQAQVEKILYIEKVSKAKQCLVCGDVLAAG